MPNTTNSIAPTQPKVSAIRSLSAEEINAVSGGGTAPKLFSACCTGTHFSEAQINVVSPTNNPPGPT